MISIHALREEGDLWLRYPFRLTTRFLSTPSARRATLAARCEALEKQISIHALREEGDLAVIIVSSFLPYFYPRPPRGGRPDCNVDVVRIAGFLSTPSARRATDAQGAVDLDAVFLSTPSARRATCQFSSQLQG